MVGTLDRGSRALEQNLRSFSDDNLVHHMRRQAMVAGTTLESMQVFEILRSLELLRSLPGVDPRAITILGKGIDGVNGMYTALLDGQVQRVVAHSPTALMLGTALSRRAAIHGRSLGQRHFWNRDYGRMAKCPSGFRRGAAGRSKSACNSLSDSRVRRALTISTITAAACPQRTTGYRQFHFPMVSAAYSA